MNKQKIILMFLLIMSLSLVLCSCKSQEVKDAETSIGEIGTVTLDSQKSIDTAERAVSAVPEDDRDKIENLESLRQARNEYAELAYDVITSGDKISVNSALKKIGDYTGNNKDIKSLKSDLETLKSWGGIWYQNSKYYTNLKFYLEDGSYRFSIIYGGYLGTIQDGYVNKDLSKKQGTASSDDLGGQTFHITFGEEHMVISWAEGSISHDLARE